MNDTKNANALDEAKKLMGALLRQPPKLHEEMKVGKGAAKCAPATKGEKDKPKDAR